MKSIYQFIPYEKLTLETKLSEEEVHARIIANTSENTTPFGSLFSRGSSSEKFFNGYRTEHGFLLVPSISYRNSFLPKIEVRTESLRFGTTIDLKLQLNAFVKVFGMIWLGVVFIILIVNLSLLFDPNQQNEHSQFAVPLFMFLVVYGMFWGGFKYESARSRKFLQEVLEANEMNDFN